MGDISFANRLKTFVPLWAILSNEVFKLYYLNEIKSFSFTPREISLVISVWLGLQFIFSTVFGFISDKYCRKKTLLVTIFLSFVAVSFMKLKWVWAAVAIDGVFCNITPVARAAYLDISLNPRKIMSVTNTFIAQAIPWILVPMTQTIFTTYSFDLAILFCVVVFLLTFMFFKDERDKKVRPQFNEIHHVLLEFSTRSFIFLTIAFLLLEVNYQILAFFSEIFMASDDLRASYILLGIGFGAGCFVQRIWNFNPAYKVINLMAFASLVLVVFGALTDIVTRSPLTVTFLAYIIIAFLSGIYLPAVYAAYSERVKMHEMGLVFGVLESIQTLAELIVPIMLPSVILWKSKNNLTFFPLILLLLAAFVLTSCKQLKRRSEQH